MGGGGGGGSGGGGANYLCFHPQNFLFKGNFSCQFPSTSSIS